MILFPLGHSLMHNTLPHSSDRQILLLPLKGQLRNEAVVMRETLLNAGRVLSIAAPLAFTGDPESAMLPVVLSAAAVTQVLICFLAEKPGRQPEESR